MQVTLTVRHGEAPDTIKQYAEDQVEGLARFFERLVEADIILDHEVHGDRYIAEVRVHTSNDTHFASSEAGDFRTAIDQTIEKLRRQIKRHKGKLIDRKLTKVDRERLFAARAGSDKGENVPAEWDRITSDEARSRLLVSVEEEILVFVDVGDGIVKIASRDGDGAVDVVDAEAFEVEEL